jgi:hypothetical protein
MRRLLLLMIIASVVACRGRTEPEQAVVRFAEAIRQRHCERAWSLLSARTRSAYELFAQHPTFAAARTARESACDPAIVDGWEWKIHRPRTIDVSPARATVVMKRAKQYGEIVPGFSGVLTKYVDDPTAVVLEDGAWHVELKFIIDWADRERQRLDEIERAKREPVRRVVR